MPILWKDKNDRELSIEAAQITNNNRRVTRLLPVSGGLSRLDSPIKQHNRSPILIAPAVRC